MYINTKYLKIVKWYCGAPEYYSGYYRYFMIKIFGKKFMWIKKYD